MCFGAKKPVAYFCLSKSRDFWKVQRYWPHCIKVPGLTPVEISGYFLRTKFLTPKTHFLCGLSKSWGFKRVQRYWANIVSKSQLQHLSKRTTFFDAKNPCPILLVKILGFLKSAKILGLHSIKIPSLNTCQNLGVFHKNHVFWRQKPMSYFICRNLGIFFLIFKEYRDFWPTLYHNFRFNTFQKFGVFHKNHVFWRQKLMANF